MKDDKDCNHKEHTAVTVCSHCRVKTGREFSGVFVCLIGLVLFFAVFTGILVFGSKCVASDYDIRETDMDFESACLWLNEDDYATSQSTTYSLTGNDDNSIAGVELEKTLSDGTVICLRPFYSLAELQQFLDSDRTNECVYSRDFDCDDFAFMLSQHALNKGYQIFPFAEDNHLKNVAHVAIGDSIVVYTIEPQTDEIRIWGKID